MSNQTTFENKCLILADLWLNYKDDAEFSDFITYNDIGLPLAYMLANDLVKPTSIAEKFVNETFDLLISGLGIEDEGFELLDDLFS